MIIICTHQSPDILNCLLQSLQRYETEKHKIVVVETSNSEMSAEVCKKYKCNFINTNLKYEIGAYKHALNIFTDENEYFCFQDSLEILDFEWESVFRQACKSNELVALCSFDLKNDPCPGCGVEVFEKTFHKPFPLDEGIAVMTNNFYVTQIGKNKLLDFGLNKLEAHCKNDTYATERLIGAISYYSCGATDLSGILGEYEWSVDHFVLNKGFTKFIQKHIKKRQ